jgi:ketopantoate reductase
MNIGIIGAGNVGGTLGTRWARNGHNVAFGVRDPVNPYAPNNNLTRLQGREGYRLRIGQWRVIYELHDDRGPQGRSG